MKTFFKEKKNISTLFLEKIFFLIQEIILIYKMFNHEF